MPASRRAFLGSSVALAGGMLAVQGTSAADSAPAATPDSATLGKTPHTKFAVNVEMWLSKLPFLERMKSSAALGFPAVEFWPYEGKDIDAIARTCDELNLAIAQFTAWGFSPGMNDPKNHDTLRQEDRRGLPGRQAAELPTRCASSAATISPA